MRNVYCLGTSLIGALKPSGDEYELEAVDVTLLVINKKCFVRRYKKVIDSQICGIVLKYHWEELPLPTDANGNPIKELVPDMPAGQVKTPVQVEGNPFINRADAGTTAVALGCNVIHGVTDAPVPLP